VAGYPTNDDPFAQAVIDTVQAAFEGMGIKTGYKQTYPPTQTDFTSIGTQMKAAKVDILVQGSVADQDAAGAVKGYSQVGFQPKVSYFASGPDSASTWLQLLDKKAEGTMTSLDWLQESIVPGNKEFVDNYLKLFPNKDNVVPAEAAEAYAAGEVLAAAIKATGGTDNAKLITWLHANKVQSVEGNFGWDAAGRPQGGSFDMIQWQNGKLVIAWPANVATNGTKPTNPKPNW
jgi:branched-chain amino acid transport system substrate-binding protein